jgi:hypothetical protein
MVTWLLGPLGQLRELVTPETGINITEVRYGGIHQGLNGGRTVDVTGIKTEVVLVFEHLDEPDYRWLQALHTRHIGGQVRLHNPLRKNHMTIGAASCNPTPARVPGITLSAGDYQWVNDWPTGVNYGDRALRWYNRTAGSTVVFDQGKGISVTPLATITASVYMKAAVGFDMTLAIDWYDKNLAFLSAPTSTASVTTSWARYSITSTAPTNAAVGRLRLVSTPTNEVTLAASQWEVSPTATAWDQGGGELRVLIDQMPANSPRFPLMNCSVTLLEA